MVKKLIFFLFVVSLIAIRLAYDVFIAAPKNPQLVELAAKHLDNDGLTFVVLMDGQTDNCKPCYAELEILNDIAQRFPDTGFLVLLGTEFEKEMIAYYGLPAARVEVDRAVLRKWYHLNEGTKVFVLDKSGQVITILPLGRNNLPDRERLYYELLNAY
ncbi:MAG: hypothetical protein QNK37_01315 [Acidobacteriota bacterium]|nr:hypothetical protein [Acidobacteriota bacterium]